MQNEERETISITTPISNKVVVLKAFLTGREKRDIANSAIPTSVDYDGTEGVKGMNLVQIMNNGEDMALRTVIISIDGTQYGEDTVNTVLNMHSVDSAFIIKEVKSVADGLNAEKKTI
jgi:hypothetical protein